MLVLLLICGLALTEGLVTPPRSDTCYIGLYQQSNLLGDEVKVQGWRRNIRNIGNVLSIEVTGDPASCCFKVFSKERYKGTRITVHGGEEFDDKIEMGLNQVKSIFRLPPKRCKKLKL